MVLSLWYRVTHYIPIPSEDQTVFQLRGISEGTNIPCADSDPQCLAGELMVGAGLPSCLIGLQQCIAALGSLRDSRVMVLREFSLVLPTCETSHSENEWIHDTLQGILWPAPPFQWRMAGWLCWLHSGTEVCGPHRILRGNETIPYLAKSL